MLQDVVAVQRRSPVRVKKRTPWHPQPDGQVKTLRAGNREWFSDRLFVDAKAMYARSGYGTSVILHGCSVVALIALFIVQERETVPVPVPGFVMPVIAPSLPFVDMPPPGPFEKPKGPAPPAPPPAPKHADAADVGADADTDGAPAPVEAPTGVAPETGAESHVGTVEGGVPGGVPGGVVGGIIGGALPSGPPIARAGTDLQPPTKIKDVKPVYPPGVLPSRAQGAVVIEITIGLDGRVEDTKVLRSVPLLDQAALEAVRQWEYIPSILNGVRVTVIMTIIVNFALR
jgi:protein TonB